MHARISPLERFLLCRVFPLPFLLVGLTLITFTVFSYVKSIQSQSWPMISGVLKVEEGNIRREVSYRYEVNGAEFTSDRVIFGELGNRTPSKELQELRRLPSGTKIDVYYQPKNPEKSTISRELNEGTGFMFLLGTIFLVGGFVLAAFIPTALRNNVEQAVPPKSDRAGG